MIFDAINSRYVAFDDELYPAVGDGNVNVTLVGSASGDTFCGDLLSYQWYDKLGNLIAPLPPPLAPGNLITGTPPIVSGSASGNTTAGGPKLVIPNLTLTLPAGADFNDYTLTLCVTDETPTTVCADVNVRASHNLPPTTAIQAAPPGAPPFTIPSGSTTPRVTLIDVGGDGFETIPVQGKCTDPEGLLASPAPTCTWTAESEVTGPTFPFEDLDPADFITSYTMTAPVSTQGGSDIFLTATDDHGYTGQFNVQMRVRAATHDVQVTSITPPATVPATVGTMQTVTVNVRNNGHFAESVTVTLVDVNGTAVSTTPQPVAILGCVDTTTYPGYTIPLTTCPSTTVNFNWTPTSIAGQPHTLTATVTPAVGVVESSTTNNSASLSVAMVNQAPTAHAQSKTTNEDTSVAITLTGSDPDGDPLTFLVATGPTNGTLSGTPPNLTYAPASNYNGLDSFTFTVSDGTATSTSATVDITVSAVNDAPSFTKGGNQTVSAAAGAQTVPGWVIAMSPGPADESGQALDFIVSNNNNALFTVQPAISPTGTLTYTPLSTTPTGTATVTVRIHDNGGGTAPNVDTSAAQTFTITVNGVSTFNAPTGVTATLTATPRQVHLVWTDNATTETSYQVQRCRLSFGFCSYSTITGSPFAANTTSINNTVSSAGTYRFRVRACRTSGSPLCTSYTVSNNIAVP